MANQLREERHYADTGCDVNPVPNGCLNCPLPMCKHDDETWYLAWKREHKAAIAMLVIGPDSGSVSRNQAEELAATLGVTPRTVYRIAKRSKLTP